MSISGQPIGRPTQREGQACPFLEFAIVVGIDPARILSQNWVRFRLGRCGDRNGIGRAATGSLQFILSANTARHLLVFVLVSAAVDDKSDFKFKRLWY
jgi:hypothetical protein